jgi:amylosucrase
LYEPVAHAILNRILDDVELPGTPGKMRTFHTRLGANFYAIYSLFHYLYGNHPDFERQLVRLVSVMAQQYSVRDAALKKTDMERERDHEWFLRQEWVGVALYTEGFAGDLKGLRKHLGYLQDLGVNLVHIMPILKCPQGASDGGYAVSNFRDVDERVGTLEDLHELAVEMRKRGMLLTLDVVANHTSDEHEWAQKARAGSEVHQAYYYIYDSRDIPDKFEETMPEVFPETAPGNFTFDEAMQKWVMSVFNSYQWDLNYRNPAVFVEMLDIVLYWANRGADIIRLDAVAFLWKKIGTTCQNEREAHLILQLMKDCCQVTAPATLFIAEAIVAPVEIIKYFGEDAVIAKECEIAYNATFMALLWDAVATKNTRLLRTAIQNLPHKLDQATWLNYVRCHDDIGLGFDDRDIEAVGYDASSHRRFLVDYFTGAYPSSPARGQPFGRNHKTGDARISGSLASLIGLETALEKNDRDAIQDAIDTILLLHSMIMSFGGIPLLYYGDELGTVNDTSFQVDPSRANDSRWIHRPRIDWTRAERRFIHGTPEQQIFEGLNRMIAARKSIPAFADYNNRELIDTANQHLFVFLRQNPRQVHDSVLVVGNFSDRPQYFDLKDLGLRRPLVHRHLQDLYSGDTPNVENDRIEIPAHGFYWLTL